MKKGVVAQMGTPQEIYYHPVDEFVADFIGEANFLKGTVKSVDDEHGVVEIANEKVKVMKKDGMNVGDEVTIVLRPEGGKLEDKKGIECEVVLSCFMGAYQNYQVKIGDTIVKIADYNPDVANVYKVGDKCRLSFEPNSVHVL